MKRHSGWLAAGLLLFAVLACTASKNGNNNNSNNSNSNNKNSSTPITRPANADVYLDKITMAKDTNGEPGETTSTFDAGDRTIHCIAELNKAKAGTKVKFVWKAVDVAGSKNEEIKTIDYTTKSFENKVHGHLTLPYDWPKGKYEVDVYINGALDKNIAYTIE
jgi:Cu/Ag efflux protein CusF